MTGRERSDVKAAIAANTKLLVAQIGEREKQLKAEIHQKVREAQNEAQREADTFKRELERLTREVNARLDRLIDRHPELFVSGNWQKPYHWSVPNIHRMGNDRERQLQQARAEIDSQVASARLAVQHQDTARRLALAESGITSAEGIEFLQSLPKIDDLLRATTAELES